MLDFEGVDIFLVLLDSQSVILSQLQIPVHLYRTVKKVKVPDFTGNPCTLAGMIRGK